MREPTAPKPGPVRHVIPFRLEPQAPIITVKVWVDDNGPFDFVVDTGASMTVISPRVAKRLDAPCAPARGPQSRAVAAVGSVEVTTTTVGRLRIGSFLAEDVEVAVMGMKALRAASKRRLDGIIGYNLLKDFRLIIDYPQGYLLLER